MDANWFVTAMQDEAKKAVTEKKKFTYAIWPNPSDAFLEMQRDYQERDALAMQYLPDDYLSGPSFVERPSALQPESFYDITDVQRDPNLEEEVRRIRSDRQRCLQVVEGEKTTPNLRSEKSSNGMAAIRESKVETG